jgi:hypothetical protein
LKRSSKLKCRYLTNGNPFLLIGPIKQEEILDSPGIWVFHDVISDSKIDLMKSLALPKVKFAFEFLFAFIYFNVKFYLSLNEQLFAIL